MIEEPRVSTDHKRRSEALVYFEAFVKRKDEMDSMGYGLRAEEWPEFVAVMRAALSPTQSRDPV